MGAGWVFLRSFAECGVGTRGSWCEVAIGAGGGVGGQVMVRTLDSLSVGWKLLEGFEK